MSTPPINKIYLHVGCGKTGSSALQVWLSQVSRELAEKGLVYPMHHGQPLSSYSVTSGNGWRLSNAIQERTVDDYFARWRDQYIEPTLLFSSECLQQLDTEDWIYFSQYATEHDIEIEVLAYVRNVYDVCYSSYVQLVKRNTYSDDFRSFALNHTTLQQFSVIKKLVESNVNKKIIHYDNILNQGLSIAESLINLTDINYKTLPPQTQSIVNRSLNQTEISLMRAANRHYTDIHQNVCYEFSAALSDRLINSDPEIATEIIDDPIVYDHLCSTMQKDVDYANSNFIENSTLEIFNRNGKLLVPEQSPMDPDFLRVTKTLLKPYLDEFSPSNVSKHSRKAQLRKAMKSVSGINLKSPLKFISDR